MSSGYFSDLQFLYAAHHLETALTTDSLRALTAAFSTIGSSARRIHPPAFVKIVQSITTQLPDDVLKKHFTEAALRQWFGYVDANSSGTAEWHEFQSALSIASAMQKHHTALNAKSGISHCKLAVQLAEKVFYLDCWRRCIVCAAGRDVKMLTAAGDVVGQLAGHVAAVSGATFIRPLAQLCTFGCDRQVLLWDHKRSTPVRQFQLETPALCAVYEPVAGLLWLGGLDGHLAAYGLAGSTGAPPVRVRRTTARHSDWIKDVIHVPELSLLMTASLDGTVKMWGLDGQLLCTKEGHTRCVHHIVYMAQVGLAFSAGQGKEICVWNPFSMDATPVQLLQGHEKEIIGLQGDCFNKSLLSCDAGGRVTVWDVGRLGVRMQVVDLAVSINGLTPVRSMCQNPVSRELMLITTTSYIRIASPLSAQRPPKLGNRVIQLLVSHEAKLALVATTTAVHGYDLIDGTQVASVEALFGPDVAIRGICLLNPLQLAAFADDRRLALMPLREFALEPSTKAHRLQGVIFPTVLPSIPAGASMPALSYSEKAAMAKVTNAPVPCRIVFSSGLCSAYKFTHNHVVQTGRESTLPLHGSSVTSVTFADDLELAVVLTDSGVVLTWHYATGATRQILSGPAAGPGTEIQQILLHRSRNALVAMHRHGLVILNIGNFLQLINVDYDIQAPVAALQATATTSSSGGGGGGAGVGAPAVALPAGLAASSSSTGRVLLGHHMALLDGDTLWAPAANMAGHVATIPLLTAFAFFFASQTRSITLDASSSEAPGACQERDRHASLAVQNSHFAVIGLMRQSVSASLYAVLDRRSSEPVVAKVYSDAASHAADWARRVALGESFDPCFVAYLAAWDHQGSAAASAAEVEHGSTTDDKGSPETTAEGETAAGRPALPRGTWPRAIVMQKGDVTLRQAVLAGSLTQEAKNIACMSVLQCVFHLLEAGFVPTDLRTRNFVRVGDAWKLCTMETLRAPGELWGRSLFAACCPPELGGAHGAIKLCPPVAEAHPIVAWMLAVAVHEIQTSTAAFADRNETTLYGTVSGLTSSDMKTRFLPIPSDSAAATILQACLVLDPAKRSDAIAMKLLNLLSVQGHRVDYGTLFARANCWRNGSMTGFPSTISEAAVQRVVRRCSGDLLAPLPLPNVSQLVTCASVPESAGGVFICVDSNAVLNGDGAIHIFTKAGEACGFVPAPELGDESLAEWLWPNLDETYARQEALQRNKKHGGGGGGGDGAAGPASAPAPHIADEVIEQLAPPPGWQAMSAQGIAQEMLRGVDLASPASALECVNRFVAVMLRKSPFFRGGQLHGEPIPMYSASLQRSGGGQAKRGVDVTVVDSERRRRWKEYWANMRLELGGSAPGATTTLPHDFLRRLPTLGQDSDCLNDDIATIFGCVDGAEEALLLSLSNPELAAGQLDASFGRSGGGVAGWGGPPGRHRRTARHEVALVEDNYLTVLNRLDRLDAGDALREKGVEDQLESELLNAGRRAAQRKEQLAAKKLRR